MHRNYIVLVTFHSYTDIDTDTDTWFIVKATDPYTRRELEDGG